MRTCDPTVESYGVAVGSMVGLLIGNRPTFDGGFSGEDVFKVVRFWVLCSGCKSAQRLLEDFLATRCLRSIVFGSCAQVPKVGING